MGSNRLQPLWRTLHQLREYYPVILVYSICISLLTLAPPIAIQSLVSTFVFGVNLQPILILSFILLVLLGALGVIKILQYLMVEYLQRKLYAKATAVIGKAYLINQNKKGDQLFDKENRYFDIILIHKNLAYLATDGLAMALQTILGLLLISLYHPFFIFFSFLILISIILPIYFLGNKTLDTAVGESTAKYDVANHIKHLSEINHDCDDFKPDIYKVDNFIKLFLHKRSSHFKTVLLQNIIYVSLFAILNALLLALGGYLVIKNQLSIGQLVAAEIVVNAIIRHFLYANKYMESFYDMHAACQKVNIFYKYLDDLQSPEVDSLDDPTSQNAHYSDFTSVKSVHSPKNYKKFFRNFILCSLAIAIFLLVAPWQQFSRGTGKVVAYNPNDRVQEITANVTGIVESWLVQDGQFVKKGEPLVKVVDNDPNYLVRLEANRDAAIAKFEAAKVATNTGRLNFHRQEDLVKEGLSSPKEFEKAKITYQKLRISEASAASSLAKAEVDLSRQQQQVINAPRDGRILRILAGSGTTNVKAGQALMEFVPKTEDPAVEIFLDGNDLPLVFEGRKVRLQFEGWPAVQFNGWPSVAIGSFGGIVSIVDPSVDADGTFRILVKPDPEDTENWPSQEFLRQGARTIGIVNLDQVSLGYELWRQINGFPKSMPEKFRQEHEKKRK